MTPPESTYVQTGATEYFPAISRKGIATVALSNVWPGSDITIMGKFDRDDVNTRTLLTLSLSNSNFEITEAALTGTYAGSVCSISDDKQTVTFTGITSNSKVTTKFNITIHNNSASYTQSCDVTLATTTYATVAKNAVYIVYYTSQG